MTSLTGYSDSGRIATSYQVLDTRYCHALIHETYLREVAERGVAILNGGDLSWPHGHVRSYWNYPPKGRKCPCAYCLDRRLRDGAAKRARRAAKRARRA